MTYLLDVNVLIALIDPAHVAHDDSFDRKLSVAAVHEGKAALHLISSGSRSG